MAKATTLTWTTKTYNIVEYESVYPRQGLALEITVNDKSYIVYRNPSVAEVKNVVIVEKWRGGGMVEIQWNNGETVKKCFGNRRPHNSRTTQGANAMTRTQYLESLTSEGLRIASSDESGWTHGYYDDAHGEKVATWITDAPAIVAPAKIVQIAAEVGATESQIQGIIDFETSADNADTIKCEYCKRVQPIGNATDVHFDEGEWRFVGMCAECTKQADDEIAKIPFLKVGESVLTWTTRPCRMFNHHTRTTKDADMAVVTIPNARGKGSNEYDVWGTQDASQIAKITLVRRWSGGGKVMLHWLDGTAQEVRYGKQERRPSAMNGKSKLAQEGWI